MNEVMFKFPSRSYSFEYAVSAGGFLGLDGKRKFQKQRQSHSFVLSESLPWGRGGSSAWVVPGGELQTNSRRMWEVSLSLIFCAPTGTIWDSLPPQSGHPVETSVCSFGVYPLLAALHGPQSAPRDAGDIMARAASRMGCSFGGPCRSHCPSS